MYALTMNDHVFVFLEDPGAPTRADVIASTQSDTQMGDGQTMPPHYRTTCLTLRPPGALEQLLNQLSAPWVPVRQNVASAQRSQGTAQQLSVEGYIFAIGNDWLVRVGNVVLAGGAVKGMLLEVSISSITSPACASRYLG